MSCPALRFVGLLSSPALQSLSLGWSVPGCRLLGLPFCCYFFLLCVKHWGVLGAVVWLTLHYPSLDGKLNKTVAWCHQPMRASGVGSWCVPCLVVVMRSQQLCPEGFPEVLGAELISSSFTGGLKRSADSHDAFLYDPLCQHLPDLHWLHCCVS